MEGLGHYPIRLWGGSFIGSKPIKETGGEGRRGNTKCARTGAQRFVKNRLTKLAPGALVLTLPDPGEEQGTREPADQI